jgi:hypothetical protein
MRRNGLGELYTSCVEGKQLPPLEPSLAAVGFTPKEVPAKLTYFGIRVEKGSIAELDPEGPAAKAGFRVGDRIIGRYPGSRSERVRVGEQVTTKYRFGLETTEPGVPGTNLDVVRGKDEMTIRVSPHLIDGGFASRYDEDATKLKAFFAFGVRQP